MPGLGLESDFVPVLVRLGEGWSFALLVERLPEGFCTIYVPDSPTPTSGSVMLVEASRVRPLSASVLSLLGCLTRSGVGAGALALAAISDPIEDANTTADKG